MSEDNNDNFDDDLDEEFDEEEEFGNEDEGDKWYMTQSYLQIHSEWYMHLFLFSPIFVLMNL